MYASIAFWMKGGTTPYWSNMVLRFTPLVSTGGALASASPRRTRLIVALAPVASVVPAWLKYRANRIASAWLSVTARMTSFWVAVPLNDGPWLAAGVGAAPAA